MPIVEILESLGLRSFAAPLTLLLERLAAIDMVLDADEERAEAIFNRQLAECVHLSPVEARVFLMQVCVGLPAFRYRAGAVTGRAVWQPLRESLHQFREQYGDLVFWLDGDLCPSVPETLEWLKSWDC
ncbi:MAG: hypothetical protein ACT4PZ_19005 [Panacagrimonas sp.]